MASSNTLDRLYHEVQSIILSRQNPVTGLLPASTSITTHGDYTDAWVRDNVYSIICVWALYLAYKHTNDTVRCDQLEQSTRKLMRGLLVSMMRQSHKVELFKKTNAPHDALHAKYNTETGLNVVADDAWGHLQIDATSIFLLMLAQMTSSGLRLIFTYDEVDFVQNLVYYISCAHRTPDFGIWERGNKINNGKTEINASSVGMAKSALQALDGLNLFGNTSAPRAVIHIGADVVPLTKNTLTGLLPRESLSKEVDSALLSVIGYPAFAVDDPQLVTKTRDKILSKLGGNYGCKRFLWDGHQTAIEEKSRIYYEHSELANFENIESEWPLFYTYLYLQALFDGNDATAAHYRVKIESVMVEKDGFKLIPELYFLEKSHINEEKKKPKSQPRSPNENLPLVWAQSLYITGRLLDEGLISSDELDPLGLRQHSNLSRSAQVAMVILSENESVKRHLANKGLITESLEDIRPMHVISAAHLGDTFQHVGENAALGLTGRPERRVKSLATSQTYEINGQVCLCLTWLQSEREDYRLSDAQMIQQNIQRELKYIQKHWLRDEVAVFTLVVDQHACDIPESNTLLEYLRQLQLREENQHIGYASANLAYRASRVENLIVPKICVSPIQSFEYHRPRPQEELHLLLQVDAQEVLHLVYEGKDDDAYNRLCEVVKAHTLSDNISHDKTAMSLSELVHHIYHYSKVKNLWLTARYCFSLLQYSLSDISDAAKVLSARHLTIVVGHENKAFYMDSAVEYSEIVKNIEDVVESTLERTLVHEIIAVLSTLIRTDPTLLEGLRTIQTHHLLALCQPLNEKSESYDYQSVGKLSPSALFNTVRRIFESQRRSFARGLDQFVTQAEEASTTAEDAHAVDTDWLEWRQARGSIMRFGEQFLEDIWQSLSQTPKLYFGDTRCSLHVIDCKTVQQSMTSGEESFARLIDHMTQEIHPSYYKSAVVESLYAFTQYCKDFPEKHFSKPIIFGEVLEAAAAKYVKENDIQLASERNLDLLMEQAPKVLQFYTRRVFGDISTTTEINKSYTG